MAKRILGLIFLLYVALSGTSFAGQTLSADRVAAVEQLLDASGVRLQLQQMAVQIGSEAPSQYSKLPEKEASLIRNAMANAFTAEALCQPVKENFQKNYNPGHVSVLLQNFQTPVFKKMKDYERQVATPEGRAGLQRYMAWVPRNPLPGRRLLLIQKLSEATGDTEMFRAMMVSMIRGMARVVNPILPPEQRKDPAELEQIVNSLMDEDNPQMQQLKSVMDYSSAYAYRSASDDEVREYTALWSTDAGKWFNETLRIGFSKGVMRASEKVAAEMKNLMVKESPKKP